MTSLSSPLGSASHVPTGAELEEAIHWLEQLRSTLEQQSRALVARDIEESYKLSGNIRSLCQCIEQSLSRGKACIARGLAREPRAEYLHHLGQECRQLQQTNERLLGQLTRYFEALLSLRKGRVVVYKSRSGVVYCRNKHLLFKV